MMRRVGPLDKAALRARMPLAGEKGQAGVGVGFGATLEDGDVCSGSGLVVAFSMGV
jgi:hypothetical protein